MLKPVAGAGGYGILIGPQASDEELEAARSAVSADPRAWIAQELVALSTAPTSVDNHLVPRHLDLRPFAVNDGQDIWVMPGGLTRVALRQGSLVVNSSQGGGSKDTWVTLSTPRPASVGSLPQEAPSAVRPRLAPGKSPAGRRPEPGPGLEDRTRQQQQQQQQQDQQHHDQQHHDQRRPPPSPDSGRRC